MMRNDFFAFFTPVIIFWTHVLFTRLSVSEQFFGNASCSYVGAYLSGR